MNYMKNGLLKLNIQLFAEDGGDGGTGGSNGGEPAKTVSKEEYDKVASQLAAAKKALKTKETDDEKFAREQKEKDDKIAELELSQNKYTLEKGLMKANISAKEAEELAASILSGDVPSIADAIGKFYTNSTSNLQKEIDALRLSQIDKPDGGTEGKTITAEDFSKMTIDEKIRLKNSDPDLFDQLNKK